MRPTDITKQRTLPNQGALKSLDKTQRTLIDYSKLSPTDIGNASPAPAVLDIIARQKQQRG